VKKEDLYDDIFYLIENLGIVFRGCGDASYHTDIATKSLIRLLKTLDVIE
jgi:hypothetical protein